MRTSTSAQYAQSSAWYRTGRNVFAVVASVCAVFAVAVSVPVPLIGWIPLVLHQAGHFVLDWGPVPATAHIYAALAAQTAVPFVLSAYFAFVRRDLVWAAFWLAIEAFALSDAGRYASDHGLAEPGGLHDFAYLGAGESVGTVLHVLAIIGALGALGTAVAGLVQTKNVRSRQRSRHAVSDASLAADYFADKTSAHAPNPFTADTHTDIDTFNTRPSQRPAGGAGATVGATSE